MSKFNPLFTLCLSATLSMIGVGMIVALLPQRVFVMAGSIESVGLFASIFALAYLLSQLPVGILSDRFGPKLFLILGYWMCGIAGLVFFSAQNVQTIFIGRAIQGIGEAPIWALGPAALSIAYPNAKGRAVGIYNAAIHAGLTLGPLLGLLVVSTGQDNTPFLIFAGLCFGAGVVVIFGLRKDVRRTKEKRANVNVHVSVHVSVHQFVAILRQRKISIILLGILLYGAGYGVFVSILPISLSLNNGLDSTSVTIYFVVFYAAISVAQLVAGPVSDRIGRTGFMVWGMAAAAAGIVAFLSFPGIWVLIPLGFASIGLGVFCVASITALNECVVDDLKGTISGAYYFFWASGYMLGPLLIGGLVAISPCIGYSVLGLLLALYSIVVWLVPK